MTDLHLDATSRTPAIALEQTARRLVIAGESYPEDVSGFYAALTTALEGYFACGAFSSRPRSSPQRSRPLSISRNDAALNAGRHTRHNMARTAIRDQYMGNPSMGNKSMGNHLAGRR